MSAIECNYMNVNVFPQGINCLELIHCMIVTDTCSSAKGTYDVPSAVTPVILFLAGNICEGAFLGF